MSDTDTKKKIGRPNGKITLEKIVPHDFGEHVAKLVTAHYERFTFKMSADPSFRAGSGGGESVRWSAKDLCGFARSGLEAVDWPDISCVDDALIDVCSLLYSTAAEPSTFGVGVLDRIAELDETDLHDPISLVLLAAHARKEINRGAVLYTAHVAALASLSKQGVLRLVDVGELKSLGGTKHAFSAAEAKRFLTARGVRGL